MDPSAPTPNAYPPPPQQYPPPQQQYPPPQQQYPPPQQQQYPPPQAPTTVTVVQTGGGGGVTCPSCQNNVTPTTMQKTGSSAWVWVLVIFLLGFFFPILWW